MELSHTTFVIKMVTPSEHNTDHKFNIVISGIPECNSGSLCLIQLAQESIKVTATVQKLILLYQTLLFTIAFA